MSASKWKAKPTQKEIDDSFRTLDILSGKIPAQISYELYGAAKRKDDSENLTAEQYERKVKALADKLGI